MTTVHVEVTQEIIDQHGADLGDCENCPGYHALEAAGIEVSEVAISCFSIIDDDDIAFPEEFRKWQLDGFDAQRAHIDAGRSRHELSSVLKPISFDVEIPEEVAP